MRRPRTACAAVTAVIALTLAACGGSSSGASSTTTTSTTTAKVTGSITVSAASSLTGAFTTIGRQFSRVNPNATVSFNFGSSGVLATQIQQGAPVDTFASADTTHMSTLSNARLVTGTPRVFARNRLVIVTKPGNPSRIASVKDLADVGTVALCALTAPCGTYSAQVLTTVGVTIPETSVTRGVDAKATIAAVTTGDAVAAIVYVTDAKAAGAAVRTIAIPDAQNVIATYPMATVRDAKEPTVSKAFIAYVLSPKGQAVLRRAGFITAP